MGEKSWERRTKEEAIIISDIKAREEYRGGEEIKGEKTKEKEEELIFKKFVEKTTSALENIQKNNEYLIKLYEIYQDYKKTGKYPSEKFPKFHEEIKKVESASEEDFKKLKKEAEIIKKILEERKEKESKESEILKKPEESEKSLEEEILESEEGRKFFTEFLKEEITKIKSTDSPEVGAEAVKRAKERTISEIFARRMLEKTEEEKIVKEQKITPSEETKKEKPEENATEKKSEEVTEKKIEVEYRGKIYELSAEEAERFKQLNEQLTNINKEIDEQEKKLQEIGKRMKEREGKITALRNRLKEINEAIAKIEKKIEIKEKEISATEVKEEKKI